MICGRTQEEGFDDSQFHLSGQFSKPPLNRKELYCTNIKDKCILGGWWGRGGGTGQEVPEGATKWRDGRKTQIQPRSKNTEDSLIVGSLMKAYMVRCFKNKELRYIKGKLDHY